MVIIGRKYRVRASSIDNCGTYSDEDDNAYIIITSELGGTSRLKYKIYDDEDIELDWCECFTSDDLEPYGIDPNRKLIFIN